MKVSVDRHRLLNEAIGVLKKHPYSDIHSPEMIALHEVVREAETRVNKAFCSALFDNDKGGLYSITLKSKVLC